MTTDTEIATAYSEQYLQQRTQTQQSKSPASAAATNYADLYSRNHTSESVPAPAEPKTEPRQFATDSQPAAQPTTVDAPHLLTEPVDNSGQADNSGRESTQPKLELHPRGPMVALSRKTERQLAGNGRELGMIQGNLSAAGRQTKLLCFTSCFDGEGKTTAALNAAYGLASGGEDRVLLVDGNLAHPRLQRLFSADPEPGLQEILNGECSIEDALHPTQYPGLDLLPAGGNRFGGSFPVTRMKAFLDIVENAYDYVIVDGTSIFTSSDASRIAPLFDGMVLVVACEQTKWEVVQSAEERISNAGGEILGVALNKRKFHIPKKVYQWLSG